MNVPSRPVALAEASCTAAIWGSSFVIVKVGLDWSGPLTLAGLRYFISFLLLLPFLVHNVRRKGPISWRRLLDLALVGLCAYTLGNGFFFVSLKWLPATTASFLLSLQPLAILGGSILWLKEAPNRRQMVGVICALLGMSLFFWGRAEMGQLRGVVAVTLGMVGFVLFALLGRRIARERLADTLTLTTVPLGVGGAALLILGTAIESTPVLPLQAWGIIACLVLLNTVFAYLIYNHALQVLTALEMNMILNMSPFATALLAWVVLSERLVWVQIVGMVLAAGGAALAQRPQDRQEGVQPLVVE